jgi:hypothetical protein
VHIRQYAQGLAEAGGAVASVPVYTGSYAGGAQSSWAGIDELARSIDGTGASTWPWPDSNLSFIGGVSFHGYPDWYDDQSLFNSVFYPTFTPGKSGYQAAGDQIRKLLLDRGRPDLGLAQTEQYYPFLSGVTNDYRAALNDVSQAIVSVDKQQAWNLRAYFYQTASRQTITDTTVAPPTTKGSPEDGLVLYDGRTGSPTYDQMLGNVRYYALRDIVSPFVRNYKQQVAFTLSGGSSTPPGGAGNSVGAVHAAVGLSADGTKLATMVVNVDLTNPADVTINLGSHAAPGGKVTGVSMPNTQSWSSLPTIAPITVSGTNFTRTLGPGEADLLLVPLGRTQGK